MILLCVRCFDVRYLNIGYFWLNDVFLCDVACVMYGIGDVLLYNIYFDFDIYIYRYGNIEG